MLGSAKRDITQINSRTEKEYNMLEKLQKAIREHAEDDSIVITEETTFAELSFDSLEIMEFVMNLEDEFGVSIQVNESMRTIGDLIKVLEEGQQ